MTFTAQVYHQKGHLKIGSYEGYVPEFKAVDFEDAYKSQRVQKVIRDVQNPVEVLILSYSDDKSNSGSKWYTFK